MNRQGNREGTVQPVNGGALRSTLFMTVGQSLGGTRPDHLHILQSMRNAGLEAELVDLANLRHAEEGVWYLKGADGAERLWTPPHSALMYHGAIAPPGSTAKLTALQQEGTSVVTSAPGWNLLTDKLMFADDMGARGVRVIPTERVADEAAMAALKERNGGSAVFKPAVSTEGDGVFVLGPDEGIDEAVRELRPTERTIIGQPVIASKVADGLEAGIMSRLHERLDLPAAELDRRGIEFRVHTIRHADGSIELPATYARVGGSAEQRIGNVAQGATAHAIDFGDLHPIDQETILHAARSLPKDADIAGWDLIGRPMMRRIIEGNSGPGLPNGSEGFAIPDVVRGYGQLLRDRAEQVAARG